MQVENQNVNFTYNMVHQRINYKKQSLKNALR
jgi:hypothetical protein